MATDLERLWDAARQGRPLPVGGARRELPPLKVKVDFDGSELDRGEVQMELFGREVGRKLDPASGAFDRLGNDAERATSRVSTGMKNMGDSTDKANQSLLDLGRAGVQPMNALIGLAVALGIALTPLLAYTAGLTAALAVGGLVVGGMGLLGAAVVALAAHYGNWAEANKTLTAAQASLKTVTEQHEAAVLALDRAQLAYNARPTAANLLTLQSAQEKLRDSTQNLAAAQDAVNKAAANAQNPLTTLTNNIDAMAKRLGEQAVPAATQILQFLNALIPAVEEFGRKLITWFSGERLNATLALASRLFNDVLDAAQKLGQKLGPVFDDLLTHPEPFKRAFQEALHIVTEAVGGLLGKFVDLMKWWDDHHDELAGAAERTMKRVSQAFDIATRAIGDGILKIAEYEKQLDEASNRASGDLNKITGSSRDTNRALEVLGGLVGWVANQFVTTFFSPMSTMLFLFDQLSSIVEQARKHWSELQTALSGNIGVPGNLIWLIDRFNDLARAVDRATQRKDSFGSGGGGGGGSGGHDLQHGGTLAPGRWARVGEVASELLYAMPGGGALVVPEAGGDRRNQTFNLTLVGVGAVADPEGVRRMLLRMQRLGTAT